MRLPRSDGAHSGVRLHCKQFSYSACKVTGEHARPCSDVGDNGVPIQLAFRKHRVDGGGSEIPAGLAVTRSFCGKPANAIHHFPSAKRRKNPLSSNSRVMLKSVRSAAFNRFTSGFWAEISSIKV